MYLIKIFIVKLLILFFTIGFVNCKEQAVSEVNPVPVEKNLQKATLLYEVSLKDLKNLANAFGQAHLSDQIKHGIAAYKIVYETTYKGESINASGIMYLPTLIVAPAPILSLQHGTTFLNKEAPSVSGSFSGMEYFAAGGYVTFMPDFIGYGESADVFHPYYDPQHSAYAVIDLIKAGKKFMTENEIPFNDQLFLAGYSEGGYVTLAAAKEIDLQPEHNLQVTAIAAGAGGYDLTEMLELIRTHNTYPYPAYLAFVIMSYNETYGWKLPLSYFFNEKYASILNDLMDGSKSGSSINAALTKNLNELFTAEFYNKIKDGTEVDFQNAILNNSFGLDSWVPQAPTRLYHGIADNIVPIGNSEKVYGSFKSKGAKDVEFIKIEQGTHGSSILPMVQSLIPWFENLKNNRS